MANSELFWNLLAKRYAKKSVPDQAVYEDKLRVTQDLMRQEMSVLEFGCGTGTTALHHAQHVNRYTAIDSSSKMIEIAKMKLKESTAINVKFVKSSFDRFEAPAESFDMVLGLSILHLVEDPEATVRKVQSLLKPGGYIVTSTACLATEPTLLKGFIHFLSWLRVIPKIQFLSRSGLQQMISGLGFSVVYEMSAEQSPQVAFFIHQKPYE